MNPTTLLSSNVTPLLEPFRQLQFKYEAEHRILWGYMAPIGLPNFSLDLLSEMRRFDEYLVKTGCEFLDEGERKPVEFYVAGSKANGIFNLGGDLGLFLMLIKGRDKEALTYYGRVCIENLFRRIQHYGSRNLTTIALLQGDAMGGGFELALANDVIVAERQVRMGFPEILFNLFPGMGALSLLTRKIGMHAARRLVTDGVTYTADEMHAMGIVDVVAEEGLGETAVRNFIKENDRRWNGMRAVNAGLDLLQPLPRQELDDVVDIWVDAALQIRDKDLRMMDKILSTQKRRLLAPAAPLSQPAQPAHRMAAAS